MKKLKVVALVVASLALSVSTVWGAVTTLTADQAFAQLQAGNAQYVKGRVLHLTAQSQPSVRISSGTNGQTPYAVVLGCIDSRVPPEIIFDRGLNEVFSVRVAGNVIAPHEIGSIEYSVEHVGVPLIVILGHSKCGAVTSSVDYALPYLTAGQTVPEAPVPVPPAVTPGNYVNSLVNSLLPPIQATWDLGVHDRTALIEDSIVENVKMVAEQLRTESLIVEELILAGKVKLVAGKYDVITGQVTWIPLP